MGNPDRRESGQADSSEGIPSAQQNQNSRQSMGNTSTSGGQQQAEGSDGGRSRKGARQNQSGIGASQRQDRESPDLNKQSNSSRDIEQAGQGNSQDSLVNDSTGAFKERP
jgi:hypothetical protein